MACLKGFWKGFWMQTIVWCQPDLVMVSRGGCSQRKLLDKPGTRLLSASKNPSKNPSNMPSFLTAFSHVGQLWYNFTFLTAQNGHENISMFERFSIKFFESYNSRLPAVSVIYVKADGDEIVGRPSVSFHSLTPDCQHWRKMVEDTGIRAWDKSL